MSELPLYQTIPVPLYAAMLGYYHLAAPHFKNEKQRAYILSTFSAGVMSAASIPFVYTYLISGMEGVFETGQEGWLGMLAQLGVTFFGVYLFADLTLGYVKYPSQIGLLTGWVHHTVYITLMIYCVSSRQSPVFLTCAMMELPTLDLAVSNLFPSLRNDRRFLSSFFLIRIVYNAVLLIDCLRPSTRGITDGSWVPTGTLFMAGALHVSWFHGGLTGYLKRQRRAKSGAQQETVTSIEPSADTVPVTAVNDAVLSTSPASTPGTPDDSPLITPRTPSITPMSLRDTYLPTLAIPSIPNLPSLHIPALPQLNVPNRFIGTNGDLNFGFRDAVKSRWEDRRNTLGGIGLNLNLNLGGLGSRRRAVKVEEAEARVQEVPVYD